MNTWIKIKGFPLYEVNEDGQVRSWRKKKRIWRNPEENPGVRDTPIIIPGSKHPKGYVAYILRDPEGKIKRMMAHRLVVLAFIGEAPTKLHTDVAHNDGNPSNNHVSNLRWATHRENQMDMRKHGTMQDGAKCITAKLTPEQVKEIRSRYIPRQVTQYQLAEDYKVAVSTINHIVNRKKWVYLE